MKYKKIAIGIGGIVIAVVLCVCGIMVFNNTGDADKKQDNTEALATEQVTEEDGEQISQKDADGNDIITMNNDGSISYSYENEDILAVQEYMNTYDHIGIYYEVIDYIPDEDKSNVVGRYLSEVYINEKTDDTREFTNAEDASDWEGAPVADFKEVFGVSNKQYDKAFDLVIGIANAKGFNIDLDHAAMNESLYESYGDMLYDMNEYSYNSKAIMSGQDYDEVSPANCAYVLAKDNTGNLFLNYFTSTTIYTKDNKDVYRYITCRFTLFLNEGDNNMQSSEMSGCDCNSDTDCNTGEDNGVGCETDCEMDESISY